MGFFLEGVEENQLQTFCPAAQVSNECGGMKIHDDELRLLCRAG